MTRRGERGFTLIEMLVALAVFSIAALALLRLNAFALTQTAELETRSIGAIVAQNRAAEVLTDPGPLTLGTAVTAVTNGGRDWRVEVAATPLGDGRVARVDVRAVPVAGGSLSVLTVVRAAR